jgi:hypothetical protein
MSRRTGCCATRYRRGVRAIRKCATSGRAVCEPATSRNPPTTPFAGRLDP